MAQFLRKYSYYFYSIFELLAGFKNPVLVISVFLKTISPGIKTVELRQSGLQFRQRGAMDIWSIKETFLDRCYEKYGFPVQEGWSVIDIGAGLGEYTLYSARVVGTNVFAFEPFPESFALLQENLRLNDITNVQSFEEAVGSQSGNLILDLSSGEPLKFQSTAKHTSANHHSLSVRSISLADVFDRSGIESCDLMKLDCEGAEYDILMKAPPSVLEKIEHIVMEYHDHVADHTHVELIHFLEAQGYQVNVYPNLVLPYLGYLRAKREKR